MSWRVETEPTGEKAIVISGWENGIGDSPYNGLQDVRNGNIMTIPGEVSSTLGVGSAMSTSGATMGKLIHWAIDLGAGGLSPTYYVLDQDGHVFKLSAGTWTSTGASTTNAQADNQGLCYLPYGNSGSGYLLRFRNTNVDYYDGATWTNGWKTNLQSGVSHHALFAQDGVVYICNGQNIASLTTDSSFVPGTPATYTWTTTALATGLPANDTATCICQQSTNLLIGGVQNAIYPWDRVSVSFNYPIYLADGFIKNMVTANTNAFVFTGGVSGRGRIYITNGTNADLFYKMPDNLISANEPYWVWGSSTYPSMNAIWHRNNLIFSVQGLTNGGTAVTSSTDRVFALDLEKKALRSVGDFPAITASGTIVVPVAATTSGSTGMGFYAGYYDGVSAYGIVTSVTNLTNSVFGNFQTDIIPVGTFTNKKTFTQFEYKLSAPLSGGESINVYYATDLSTGWTQLKNFTTTGLLSDMEPVNFEKVQWVQFRILTTAAVGGSGVRLKEVRIR